MPLAIDRTRPLPAYRLEIPSIGVKSQVVEGIDDEPLMDGPGHYPKTPFPGEMGNAALAGHRTVYGKPSFFYKLDKVKVGDTIRVAYPNITLEFTVERVFITHPYDLSVLQPTDYMSLTLTTCDPPGTNDNRLIVKARFSRNLP